MEILKKSFIIIIPCLIAVAVILFLTGKFAGREFTVGKSIKAEDITQFNYTVSSLSPSPAYCRYRFFVENGKYMFSCEKREGECLPPEKNNVTFSTEAVLSDEQWNRFVALIQGGKAVKIKEQIESGDKGPWIFIYWKNDKSVFREFSFSSNKKSVEFEEFCMSLSRDYR